MTITHAPTPATNAPLALPEPQSFSDEGDRRRLSSTALKAFRSVAKTWSLTIGEASSLLAVSPSTWERLKRDGDVREVILNQDQLTRISAVIGVYKGLHLLFANSLADRWPRLRNKGPLFEGQTPIETMIEGGIPRLLEVRRHIDALRGGL